MYIYTSICMYIQKYINIYPHICLYIHIYVYIYIYMAGGTAGRARPPGDVDENLEEPSS